MNFKLTIKKYVDFCKKRNITIKSHQVYGILWCLQREELGKGGVLADEMGMGKTLQMIGTMILNPQRKTLILLPPILIQQWYLEIERICGHRAIVYYGKNRREFHDSLENAMIVITSYETCLRDTHISDIHWNRIICDEAHHLRNPKTKTFLKIQSLQTRIFWCLTGTPIHNSPKDLASLFSLCNIHEKTEWKKHFLQRFQPKNIGDLRENVEMLEWKNETERKMAKDIHATIPCLGFGEKEDGFWEKTKTCTLVSMIRASQMCIFPKMIQSSLFRIDSPLEAEYDEPIPAEYLETLAYGVSTKLQAVISHILERKENGNGKIVFCHYRLEMQRIVEILKTNGVDWVGDYKTFQKQTHAVTVKTPILVMQIRSGCEGLNLQAQFSEVYFVSPNWNPALESQAIGRCFRIGQTKRVEVYRFYMNCVNSAVNNEVYQKELNKYCCIIQNLPDDISRYISEFIDPLDTKKNNYSLDKYIQNNQERKREKIEDFLKKLR